MVRNDLKSIILFYLQTVLIWIVAILFLAFLRNYGADPDAVENPIRRLSFGQKWMILSLVGGAAGIMYASLELLYDRPYFQRHSYGRIIIGKLIFFFIMVKIMMAILISIMGVFLNGDIEPWKIIQLLRSKIYWVIFVYFLLIAGLISFVSMINQKFGPGILWNMFIGKYRNPREEIRVFMFLDLKSSTTIAEKLSHVNFSRLIQNCFADLTPVVTKHKVEIYQYVGDEAILSWPIEKGFEHNHCIHCYFDFMEVLAARADYYENEFGLQPFFKAGVHLGKVIVAEVGLIKREIAYHGDVLNTTARIQSRCNELQQPLLISDELLQFLKPDQQIQSQHLGSELLKGKKTAVTIFGVTKVGMIGVTPHN